MFYQEMLAEPPVCGSMLECCDHGANSGVRASEALLQYNLTRERFVRTAMHMHMHSTCMDACRAALAWPMQRRDYRLTLGS